MFTSEWRYMVVIVNKDANTQLKAIRCKYATALQRLLGEWQGKAEVDGLKVYDRKKQSWVYSYYNQNSRETTKQFCALCH